MRTRRNKYCSTCLWYLFPCVFFFFIHAIQSLVHNFWLAHYVLSGFINYVDQILRSG